jgi:aminocarboxymuconate-semialdehyde decarboxylase
VLLGSDYCFDMGLEDPLGSLRKLNLPEGDEKLIAGGNALRLLRMTEAAAA